MSPATAGRPGPVVQTQCRWRKSTQLYAARVEYQQRRYLLGSYPSESEATYALHHAISILTQNESLCPEAPDAILGTPKQREIEQEVEYHLERQNAWGTTRANPAVRPTPRFSKSSKYRGVSLTVPGVGSHVEGEQPVPIIWLLLRAGTRSLRLQRGDPPAVR